MIIRHNVKVMALGHFALHKNVKEEHVEMDMSVTNVVIVSRSKDQHAGKYGKHLIYIRSKFKTVLSQVLIEIIIFILNKELMVAVSTDMNVEVMVFAIQQDACKFIRV